jgi:hypothetical protein
MEKNGANVNLPTFAGMTIITAIQKTNSQEIE